MLGIQTKDVLLRLPRGSKSLELEVVFRTVVRERLEGVHMAQLVDHEVQAEPNIAGFPIRRGSALHLAIALDVISGDLALEMRLDVEFSLTGKSRVDTAILPVLGGTFNSCSKFETTSAVDPLRLEPLMLMIHQLVQKEVWDFGVGYATDLLHVHGKIIM